MTRSAMRCDELLLSDLDFSSLKLVKETVTRLGEQDHSRWVFRSCRRVRGRRRPDLYYKIWNPTYVRRDNLEAALAAGFYDDTTTPALVGLIRHAGCCRGYVMRRCERNRRLDERFYRLVRERTERTGYFHVQFSPAHMMRFERTYSLIDLEAVYPLDQLDRLAEHHSEFDCADYEAFVRGLAQGHAPGAVAPASPAPSGWRRLAERARAYRRAARRELSIKWGTIRHHVRLIER